MHKHLDSAYFRGASALHKNLLTAVKRIWLSKLDPKDKLVFWGEMQLSLLKIEEHETTFEVATSLFTELRAMSEIVLEETVFVVSRKRTRIKHEPEDVRAQVLADFKRHLDRLSKS